MTDEPNVLAEAMREAFGAAAPEFVNAAREHIAKRGYAITKTGEAGQ